ncbi:MAG: 2-iminoacetate synthase ThiH [Candidatus Hydrogenedentes bacterium]|nr:2-iminoacetate synthase ThiH [Candidatus Hydrogenedentota bacterium]
MNAWPLERLEALYTGITERDVAAALAKEQRDLRDLAALLSPAARPFMEAMAREAQRLTRWHFGRTIALYAPLYISNLCAADCVYCGFSARNPTRDKRLTLSEPDLRRECAALAKHGFESVLLLTGEAPKVVTPGHIAYAVRVAREYFSSVSVEVYAMEELEYRGLVREGLEGMTLYMETYHRGRYKQVHLEGQKADYEYRLTAMERAGRAGVRKLTIGALLGLFDWRYDVLWAALHARWLQREHWQSAIGISFPRLLHTPERYAVQHFVTDADFVQIILAMRLYLPEVSFNLSTRETDAFRDRLIPLGITHMSAGSSTQPGGYATHLRGQPTEATKGREVLEQFEIEDCRPVEEVIAAIRRSGYDPVWKDYDRAFDRG